MTDRDYGLFVDGPVYDDDSIPEPPGLKILVFKYDVSQCLTGVHTRDQVRHQAQCLLDSLTALRETGPKACDSPTSQIAFYLAMNHGTRWCEITDYSRTLIFSGCPHRSLDRLDMHDRISRFLLGAYKPGCLKARPTFASVPGLSDAILEVNGLFVESKVCLRCYMLSIHAHESFLGNVHYSKLLDQERLFISLAPPIDPFMSSSQMRRFACEVDQVNNWLGSPQDQVLYLHGQRGIRKASEELFFSIQQLTRKRYDGQTHPTLYFSFDGWDTRRNGVSQMLSALLAQVVCHYPEDVKSWTSLVFAQLKEEGCWADADLISWFRSIQRWSPIKGISLVLSNVNECSMPSCNALLQSLAKIVHGCDLVCWVAVTSSQPLNYAEGSPAWRCVDLDISMTDASEPDPLKGCPASRLRFNPGLCLNAHSLYQTIDLISDGDILSFHILLEQLLENITWSQDPNCLASFFKVAEKAKFSVEEIINRLLSAYEDRQMVLPLTVRELAAAIFCNSEVPVSDQETQQLLFVLRSWFAGVDILRRPCGDPKHSYIWHEIQDSAHVRIAKTCLRLLSLPAAQRAIQQQFDTPVPNSLQPFCPTSRGDICYYAIQSWPDHLHSIPRSYGIPGILDGLLFSDIGPLWAKAFWSISNPVTRPSQRFESLCPISAGLGLAHLVEPRDQRDVDQGLVEAARHGLSATVTMILGEKKYSTTTNTIFKAVHAATSSGQENVASALLDTINTDVLKWPPSILYRAAWLDLPQLAEKVLLMGCPPEPGGLLETQFKRTPLSTAATCGNLNVMFILLDHGANIDHCGEHGQGLLHYCIALDCERAVEMLVDKQPDLLKRRDENGETAIHYCINNGQFAMLKCLLRLGADPNARSGDIMTSLTLPPLSAAASLGHLECVRALLDNHVNPNTPALEGQGTPLMFAAANGHAAVCQLLLERGANPNHPLIKPPILIKLLRPDGKTNVDVMKLLLQYGARVNATDDSGSTAMFIAVTLNQFPTVECLLSCGADPNVPTINECSLFSAINLEGDLYKLLVERGADIKIPNQKGTTPLILAAGLGRADVVEFLLQHKFPLDAQDATGHTALLLATLRRHAKIVRMLIEAGADAKIQAIRGLGAVHLATDSDTLRSLLEYRKRIDIDQRDISGATALMRALQNPHPPLEIVDILVKAGADLNMQDLTGDTALCVAAARNNLHMALTLLNEPEVAINSGSQADGAPLHLACRIPSMALVKLLIQKGAYVNNTVSIIFGTPLQAACWLRPGAAYNPSADVRRVSGYRGTALNIAPMRCLSDMIRLLIMKGADVNTCDYKRALPVHYAAFSGYSNLTTILAFGRSPLHWAAQNGRLEAARKLLAIMEPSSINDKDLDGWTPLYWAARATEPCDHLAVIRLLLRSGAKLSTKAKIGWDTWSLLQIVCYSGAPLDIIKVLKPFYRPRLTQDLIKVGGSTGTRCEACYWMPLLPPLS
ncbi:ankyrin repeat-containing domain protein [Aspergillus avenaceus]|uniref:Ankyrin repeat-containing domain protein n=1 Tax=Aspergillus avenaceus TaxID=36643 RepID=A0A5N6TEV1_ASPAV|nr:ankyrin repeat-containing domain protein [Aspergillus avenaceus]